LLAPTMIGFLRFNPMYLVDRLAIAFFFYILIYDN